VTIAAPALGLLGLCSSQNEQREQDCGAKFHGHGRVIFTVGKSCFGNVGKIKV